MENLEGAITEIARQNLGRDRWETPLDYFSWGRDERHRVDNTESLPGTPSQSKRVPFRRKLRKAVRTLFGGQHAGSRLAVTMSQYREAYAEFDGAYQLMSDPYSRNLFAELIFIKLVSEDGMRLSSFSQEFVDSYEEASDIILGAEEVLSVYGWVLRKVTLSSPQISFFTAPTILNLHLTGRLYRYEQGETLVGVAEGDTVIDAGVGWGDTTIYLAALAQGKAGSGHLYAFDILEDGLSALSEQVKANPGITNITPILRGLSEKDGDMVFISTPGPGARITEEDTGTTVETITIDTFAKQENLKKVDLIKMDIEGAEVPALNGAAETIKRHKPKLAISVYHKWDDLLVIPQLIHGIRDDYSYHLDCTTGFGGEAILYCC